MCCLYNLQKRRGKKREEGSSNSSSSSRDLLQKTIHGCAVWVKLGGGGGGPLVRLRTYEEHCVMTFEDVKKKGRKKCCVGGCINLKHLFLHLFFFFLERRPISCTCVLVRMYSEKKS